ncbi:hypothetical protein CU102_27320 [Phyllobacterium brassicacearum]|uniref:Uncharacterized protein n=1 Tax=Phyllobacterium brassicacearum TaxID=314235 RepID=A0A2P7B424_9HYPH|nr:hypothetical protein [Phyllobacterium brassicacearum]PSH61196.1 hypothetical protein CU102_27320 [Phyllobacterium brassicacearum]TDQ12885.1 hypothetical protein DEV91_14517 [Phyllobacterium brassicacearum]
MRLETDLSEARNGRFSREPVPSHWPRGVKQLSIKGSALFGVHEETGNLYWDGKLVQTSNRLANFERGLGVVLVASMVSLAMFDAIRFFLGL